jgi:hypothetical protein
MHITHVGASSAGSGHWRRLGPGYSYIQKLAPSSGDAIGNVLRDELSGRRSSPKAAPHHPTTALEAQLPKSVVRVGGIPRSDVHSGMNTTTGAQKCMDMSALVLCHCLPTCEG